MKVTSSIFVPGIYTWVQAMPILLWARSSASSFGPSTKEILTKYQGHLIKRLREKHKGVIAS